FGLGGGGLAGGGLLRTGGAGHFQYDVPVRVARPASALPGDFKRLGQQRVAGQDRNTFSEDFVVRQLAAAIVIVVHRRQIVVNKGVSVDALDRASQRQALVDRAAAGFRRCQTKGRSHPFAAGEQRVAHRFVDRRRSCRGFW